MPQLSSTERKTLNTDSGWITTTLDIGLSAFAAGTYEVEIEVEYSVERGCRETHSQPGEADTATIKSIKVLSKDTGSKWPGGFLGALLEDDEELQVLCLQDWDERMCAAAEDRADAMRDERSLRRAA